MKSDLMTSSQAWFLTGTDTGVGKTLISCALLQRARAEGKTALGMKPVAAGVEANGENEDVAALQVAGSLTVAARNLNPYLLRAPVSPHIAAAEEGVRIDPAVIYKAFAELRQQAEVLIVEGVGGFRVPLALGFDSADLAGMLALPVILVVGVRLGCLNHALLTVEAIERRGLKLAGWVANQLDPHMLRVEENIETLREKIQAPCLGFVPFCPGGQAAEVRGYLKLPPV